MLRFGDSDEPELIFWLSDKGELVEVLWGAQDLNGAGKCNVEPVGITPSSHMKRSHM